MAVAPHRLTPAQILALSILALIGVGTLLLWAPLSSARTPLSLLDAFFTATSAVCVTGLIVVDTPVDLSFFGQLVVLLLIQAGGLGYMAITTVVVVALGRHLTLHERLTLQEALNVQTLDGLIRFTLTVLKLTLAFELTGAALLALWWVRDLGVARAMYFGLFHSVSAFNNAGFALFSDSLVRYRGDWFVNAVISSLVIAGGLGFVVWSDLFRFRRTRRLSIHTRLVLVLTAALILAGTATLFVVERNNPATLQPLPIGEAALAAYFQSVTTRTAGFNTLDVGAMLPASLFIMMLLMFIGAAPGGTGGGVKVSTFGIIVVALWATIRGHEDATVFRRRIPHSVITRAFALSLIAFLAVNIAAGLVLVAERRDLLRTLFEVTSAFATVGLSTGESGAPVSLVGHFSASGKLLIAAMMFLGRVGPLTLAIAVARSGRAAARIRHPEGQILVG